MVAKGSMYHYFFNKKEMNKMKNLDIDTYIKTQPEVVQKALQELRGYILEAVPDATELINYSIPAFTLREGGKREEQVMIAGHKNHIDFYPHPNTIEAFLDDLSDYKFAKGSVQFPLNKPIPKELVIKMVRYRYEQIPKKG
jgi:uncharacterized protein YdhG (YjbR/CyaY superfamily)